MTYLVIYKLDWATYSYVTHHLIFQVFLYPKTNFLIISKFVWKFAWKINKFKMKLGPSLNNITSLVARAKLIIRADEITVNCRQTEYMHVL